MMLVLLCVLFFIFHIWLRTKVVTQSFTIGSLRNSIQKLESEIMTAKVDRTKLMSPRNLEKYVKKLAADGEKMQNPVSHQIIYARPTKNNPDD